MSRAIAGLFLTSALVLSAGAQTTSLFIPGLAGDGPLSVSEIGVGSDGRTTWAVASGAASGTDTPQFPGTATLIEGPNDAVVTYALGDGGAVVSCSISGASAVCEGTITEDGQTSTEVDTLPADPTVVAIATGSGSASNTASSPSATSTSPSSRSSSGSGSPSQTSSAPSATNSNAAVSGQRVSAGLMGVVAAGSLLSLL
ncbi:hypothetical protein GLOTRDRAFT_136656 [Gloeophyllum trabeum ATCC 11539]|uniref:GPI anchored protein n=1 Tax=Gloeophyllum trabeum (strain ATCC 11539 / FP-39264 / Madison 617) TaxID=670483 RepID=S7RSX2_GLOTA|nr:uncharacterized protein GLOTRDRAFT_136656 [Gloeophyllum trabeum ATCC 11539]EPQ57785.1 hypothetical protein GLOTRDRAFT_136656 [Gloeophyllum trabeum ATCC 11539]